MRHDLQVIFLTLIDISNRYVYEERIALMTSATIVTTPAQDNLIAGDVEARLTRMVENLVTRRRLHHAILAVATGDGRQHWSAGVGAADATDRAPGPGTPFFAASVTKRFIVALVLQAHERREVSLAAPITDYLPGEMTAGLHVLGGIDWTSAITLRHLASHTAGLPHHFEKRFDGPA